jgi:hypothetical protein
VLRPAQTIPRGALAALSVFTPLVLAALTLVALLTVPGSAAPSTTAYDPDRRPFSVPSVTGGISIDGFIDEPAWDRALAVQLAYEQQPGENTEPPAETTVLLTYGESHVYAAFLCQDPDPPAIRAHYTDRDKIWSDDWVLLVLDTFNSEREASNFACNPLGIQGDTYESPHGESDAWDAIWDSAGRITQNGYEVEMAIPFSSLRFQRVEGEQVWGFDIARNYPRGVSHRMGFFPVDRDNECYACQYSKIVGFEGASPGLNVEFDPTFTTINTKEREAWLEGDFETVAEDYDPGLTARWGITPNMTLTAAVNPDFSQVEADARQLDVNTKFALSYEERRPFFLEGADIFNDRLYAVYSRTIADPKWGVKLTGREGNHTVGAYVAQDEVTNLLVPGAEGSALTSLDTESTAAAVRYRFDLGRSSGVGVLATNRVGTDYMNRTVGADGFLRFLKSERIDFEILGSWTEYPDSTAAKFEQPDGQFSDVGYDVAYNHRSEHVNWFLHHRHIGEEFRSDLGFRPHIADRHICTGAARNWRRQAGSWFTLFEVGVTHSENWFAGDKWFDEGDLQSRVTSPFIDYGGPLQSRIYLSTDFGTEVYQGTEYDLMGFATFGSARPSNLLGLSWELMAGDGIDYANNRNGSTFIVEPAVSLRVGRHLNVTASHNYSFMDIDDERLYTTNISYLKAVYQFNSRMFLRGIVQYSDYEFTPELYDVPTDPEFRWLAQQYLFSYKINPKTVLYLGYSDNRYGEDEATRTLRDRATIWEGDLTQQDRTFFAKIGYALVL